MSQKNIWLETRSLLESLANAGLFTPQEQDLIATLREATWFEQLKQSCEFVDLAEPEDESEFMILVLNKLEITVSGETGIFIITVRSVEGKGICTFCEDKGEWLLQSDSEFQTAPQHNIMFNNLFPKEDDNELHNTKENWSRMVTLSKAIGYLPS